MANYGQRWRCAALTMGALLLLVSCASARHSVLSSSRMDTMRGPFEVMSTGMHLAAGAACDSPCENFYCPVICRCGSYEAPASYPPPPEGGSYSPPSVEGSPPPPEGGSYSPPSVEGSPPPPEGGSYSPPLEEGSPPPPEGGSYSPPLEEGSPPPPDGGSYSPPTEEGSPPPPEEGSYSPPTEEGSPPPTEGVINLPPADATPPPPMVDFSNIPPASAPASGFGLKPTQVTLAQDVCKTSCRCYTS